MSQALDTIQRESKEEYQSVLDSYAFRKVNCDIDSNLNFCFRFSLNSEEAIGVWGIFRIFMPASQGSWVYPFSSPMMARYFRLKLLKMKEPEAVQVVVGTYHQLYNHPIIKEEGRTILVLESTQHPNILQLFHINCNANREKFWCFYTTDIALEN